MASIKLSLSGKAKNGKRQIHARCMNVWERITVRLKTDIWVNPRIFDEKTGEIKNPNQDEEPDTAVEAREIAESIIRVDNFLKAVKRVIAETVQAKQERTFSGETQTEWKEWMERILFLNRAELYDHWDKVSRWTYRQMREKVEEQERVRQEREEQERKAKEQASRTHKPLFDYIDEHAQGVSPKKADVFRALKRHLLRFQYFTRQTKNRGFVLDYTQITKADVADFATFLREEHILRSRYSFIKIDKQVSEEIPIQRERAANNGEALRGENQVLEILKNLSTIFNRIIIDGKLLANPVTMAKRSNMLSQKKGGKVQKTQRYNDEPICLSKAQRDIIRDFDLSSKRREVRVCRDIFIFLCYCGARYGDLQVLTNANVTYDKQEKYFLEYVPSKTEDTTGEKASCPLEPEAVALIEKYSGIAPDGRLFPCPKENAFNATLKNVFKYCGITDKIRWRNPRTSEYEMRPLNEIASSHIGRRTFTDISFKDGVPIKAICSATGRSEKSPSIARYINAKDKSYLRAAFTINN